MTEIEFTIRVVLFIGGIITGLLISIPIVYIVYKPKEDECT